MTDSWDPSIPEHKLLLTKLNSAMVFLRCVLSSVLARLSKLLVSKSNIRRISQTDRTLSHGITPWKVISQMHKRSGTTSWSGVLAGGARDASPGVFFDVDIISFDISDA